VITLQLAVTLLAVALVLSSAVPLLAQQYYPDQQYGYYDQYGRFIPYGQYGTGGQARYPSTVIPAYTVIPVTLDTRLDSGRNNIGDQFTSRCNFTNCSGFPNGTVFAGRVTNVVRASRNVPGQIDVQFVQAILPNGTRVNISGNLTSLNSRDVYTDPNTGRLIATGRARTDRDRFIYYGAGAGLLIGGLTGNNWLEGALIGALAGWLGGQAVRPGTDTRNVVVPAGTRFGIVLTRNISLGSAYYPGYPGPGYGGGPSTTIRFTGVQPFYSNNSILMIPFNQLAAGLGYRYSVDPNDDLITLRTSRTGTGRVTHEIGSNVVRVRNQNYRLSARSMYFNNVLYVPQDFVRIVAGRNAYWNPNTGILTVQ
jgi:hypothetical protein